MRETKTLGGNLENSINATHILKTCNSRVEVGSDITYFLQQVIVIAKNVTATNVGNEFQEANYFNIARAAYS